jgi:hypothetical protein
MRDCVVHPFPGRHVALEWAMAEPVRQDESHADVALAALAGFGEVFQPLTAEVELACHNPRDPWARRPLRPASPYRQLREAGLSETLWTAPMHHGAEVVETSRLDPDSVRIWLGNALTQPCPGADTVTGWAELSILTSCARLDGEYGGPTLVVQGVNGPLEAPIRHSGGKSWVCGPLATAPTEPPIRAAFRNEDGILSLKIHIHWSCWTRADKPGRQALNRALYKLGGSGWEVVSTDLDER